jgi:hypothetical protein
MIVSAVSIVISGAYFQSKISQGSTEIAKGGTKVTESKVGTGNKSYS